MSAVKDCGSYAERSTNTSANSKVDDVAATLFSQYMDCMSAHAMTDLEPPGGLWSMTKDIQDSWREQARALMKKRGVKDAA